MSQAKNLSNRKGYELHDPSNPQLRPDGKPVNLKGGKGTRKAPRVTISDNAGGA